MQTRRIILFTAIVSAACSAENTATTVPTRLASQAAYDSLRRLTLVPSGSVCNADSIECGIDRGGKISIDGSGNIAFAPANIAKPQVRVFHSGTGVVRLLGRQGSGPGEYRSVVAIGFTPKGTLRLFDALQYRVLEYTRDGAVIATSNVPLPAGFVDAEFVRGELRIIATEHGKRSGDSAVVAMFAADSGARRPRRLFALGVRQRSYAMTDLVPVKSPFEASPRFAIRDDGGVLSSPGNVFVIDVSDSAGARTDRFGFDVAPRKVTPADLEEWQQRSTRGLPSYMRAAILGGGSRPAPYHAAITQLRAIGGRIWAREAEHGDSARWIVFEPTGAPRGTVMLSSEATVLGGRGDSVLVSEPTTRRGRGSMRWFLLRPS